MTKRTPFLRWFIPAALFFAAGFVVAALYDLPINLAVYNPRSFFGAMMEAFGWYPAFLPPIMLGLLWAGQLRNVGWPLWRRFAGAAVAMVGISVLSVVSLKYLIERHWIMGWKDPAMALWAGIPVIAALLFLIAMTRWGQATRQKLAFSAFTGCFYLFSGQTIVYLAKFIWARPRFDDMIFLDSLEFFRPWYLPFGPGGSSFPSGHTANAAGILGLLLLCDLFPAWNRQKPLVQVVCWGYIAAMAGARILIGRHFLSDTLAASAIMGMLFYALHTSKIYKSALHKTMKNTAHLQGRNQQGDPA